MVEWITLAKATPREASKYSRRDKNAHTDYVTRRSRQILARRFEPIAP
ncbi:hypothetical protein NOC27_107 [Nitrosococcus oceani AFC27]|nr:hypothetical protein NOC27_107 [Nitrosococcus oceani AFC27]